MCCSIWEKAEGKIVGTLYVEGEDATSWVYDCEESLISTRIRNKGWLHSCHVPSWLAKKLAEVLLCWKMNDYMGGILTARLQKLDIRVFISNLNFSSKMEPLKSTMINLRSTMASCFVKSHNSQKHFVDNFVRELNEASKKMVKM